MPRNKQLRDRSLTVFGIVIACFGGISIPPLLYIGCYGSAMSYSDAPGPGPGHGHWRPLWLFIGGGAMMVALGVWMILRDRQRSE